VGIRVTPEAIALIRRSLELAGADPKDVGVRLRVAGGEVRPRFVAEPRADDVVVEVEGVRIFVAAEIVAELGDVEVAVLPEHDRLVVR
jgi:Fe-S cluster assembly iron-binding protein IscA